MARIGPLFCKIAALVLAGEACAFGQASPPSLLSSSSAAVSPSPAPSPAETPLPPAPAAPLPEGTALPSPSPALSGTTAPPAVSGTVPPALSGLPAATPAPTPESPYRIEIDLEKQRAYLLRQGKTIAESPISSGRAGHLTPTGDFAVIEKDPNHLSSLYGKIVEKGSGRVVIAGADAAMAVPKGCRFDRAPMKYFLRFEGATGMHAGILPGYPASHGCVRMPLSKALFFYKTVGIGTPVHVFGTTPVRRHEVAEARPHPRNAAGQKAGVTSMPASPSGPAASPAPKKRGWFHF